LKLYSIPVAVCMIYPVSGYAQSDSGGALAFEVASIRPAPPPTSGHPVRIGESEDPAQVTFSYLPVVSLISTAYGVDITRISGGPEWIRNDFYNVVAKLPSGAAKARIPEFLRALLADRLGLVVRHESKDSPVYTMVAGKGGPKLKMSPDIPDSGPHPSISSVPLTFADGRLGICCGRAELHRITMLRFAEMLASQTDRPVIDKTGIAGMFEISLHWAADDQHGKRGYDSPPPVDTSNEGSIYSALQEQLGLKLEPRRAPLDYLFVERVVRPTDN
jgi:uncharacterized protein (TIGR03435 family)